MNQDRVCQAQKVLRASQELLGSQGKRVALDYQEFLDKMVKQGHQDLRGLKVQHIFGEPV